MTSIRHDKIAPRRRRCASGLIFSGYASTRWPVAVFSFQHQGFPRQSARNISLHYLTDLIPGDKQSSNVLIAACPPITDSLHYVRGGPWNIPPAVCRLRHAAETPSRSHPGGACYVFCWARGGLTGEGPQKTVAYLHVCDHALCASPAVHVGRLRLRVTVS